MQLAIGSALTTFGAATLCELLIASWSLRGSLAPASGRALEGLLIPPFLRRFLRGISCSGALRATYAFFPRKSHPRVKVKLCNGSARLVWRYAFTTKVNECETSASKNRRGELEYDI